MWNLLLGDIIKLNIHVHMYISNHFIRTTQQFEVEKISNSCLFCYPPYKLYIWWLSLCAYGRDFSYIYNVFIPGLQIRKLRHRDVNSVSQGHIVSREGDGDWMLSFQTGSFLGIRLPQKSSKRISFSDVQVKLFNVFGSLNVGKVWILILMSF